LAAVADVVIIEFAVGSNLQIVFSRQGAFYALCFSFLRNFYQAFIVFIFSLAMLFTFH